MAITLEYYSNPSTPSPYLYEPSRCAPIIFIALFTVLLLVKITDHIKFHQKTARKFPYELDPPNDELLRQMARIQVSVCLVPIFFGFKVEILAYIFRTISIQQKDNLPPYLVSLGLLCFGPSLIAMGVSMMFSTLGILLHGENISIVPSGFFTLLLVTGDIGCFLLQGLGGKVMSQNRECLGLALVLIGSVFRILLYAFFIVVLMIWVWRMDRNPSQVIQLMDMNESKYNWKRFPRLLIASMSFILIRCILETSEIAENTLGKGHFARSEVAFYCIDAGVILLSLGVLVASRSEYFLWEIKMYQVWVDAETEQKAQTHKKIEEGPVVWRRTSWIYS